MCLHRTRPFIRGTLGSARSVSRLGALRTTNCCGERFDELHQDCFVVWCLIVHLCIFLSAICILCGAHCPMTGWVCQWKPFWTPVDDSFKKAYVEEWVFQVTDTSDLSLSGGQEDVIPETTKVSLPVSSSSWEAPKPEDSACFRERIEAPLPPLLSIAATTYMWSFGITLLLWCYIVRLRGSSRARFRSVYHVG